MSFIGSKGALVSLLSKTERVPFRRFLEFLGRSLWKNWRVTCKDLSFGKYGAPLGPRCQQWSSCNHQWSKGRLFRSWYRYMKKKTYLQIEWRNPPNFLCTIFQIRPTWLVDDPCWWSWGAEILSATSTEKLRPWSHPLLDIRHGGWDVVDTGNWSGILRGRNSLCYLHREAPSLEPSTPRHQAWRLRCCWHW